MKKLYCNCKYPQISTIIYVNLSLFTVFLYFLLKAADYYFFMGFIDKNENTDTYITGFIKIQRCNTFLSVSFVLVCIISMLIFYHLSLHTFLTCHLFFVFLHRSLAPEYVLTATKSLACVILSQSLLMFVHTLKDSLHMLVYQHMLAC